MAITNKSKKFFLEVRVNVDPEVTPPPVPVGTFILWNDGGNDKSYFMTSTGVKDMSDIGAGGGGGGGGAFSYEIPTDIPDGVAQAGKLLKSVDGKAVVNERLPATLGTPTSWDITINSVGVAGVAETRAFGKFLFSGPIADGTVLRVNGPFGSYDFEFHTNMMMIGQGSIFVQKTGMGVEADLDQFADVVGMQVMFNNFTGTHSGPGEFTITAGNDWAGTNANGQIFISIQADPAMVVTRSDVDPMGAFQNGVDAIGGSSFTLDDTLIPEGAPPMGDTFVQSQIAAGNHWAIQGNVNDEAAAIAAAMDIAFQSMDMMSNIYTTVVVGNVITLTRGISGYGNSPELQFTASPTWDAAMPFIVFADEGTGPQAEKSVGPYIGKMVSVAAGIATVQYEAIEDYIADGAIADNALVTGANDGKVKEIQAGIDDNSEILGRAIVGGADASTVTIKYQS